MNDNISLYVQPRDSGWIKVGTQQDGGLGIKPGGIVLSSSLTEYGFNTATVKIKQDPKWISHHFEHFTPVEFRNGDEKIWVGRVIALPTMYGSGEVEVTIEMQGWGQHLKDDGTYRQWVANDLSSFQDYRSFPGNGAGTVWDARTTVLAGQGNGVLSYAKDATAYPINCNVGMIMDLGPGNLAKRIVLDWKSSNNAAAISAYAWAINTPSTLSGLVSQAFTFTMNSGASGTTAGTFSTGYRYVLVFMYFGAGGVLASDVKLEITRAQIFTDTADESGNASILKASTIIGETLTECCPLLNTDQSLIEASLTSIPNFPGKSGFNFANELVDKANSIHGYLTKVDVDKRFVFKEFDNDYKFVLGAGQYRLNEPAAQDGRAIASRIISEFEDAAGARDFSESIIPTNVEYNRSIAQLSNPSFDTNTTGWTAGAGAIARDTVTFESSPASMSISASGNAYTESFATNLIKGLAYKFTVRVRLNAGTNAIDLAVFEAGGSKRIAYVNNPSPSVSTTWTSYEIDFIAPSTSVRLTIYNTSFAGVPIMYVDNVLLESQTSNTVARRGFTRTFLRPMQDRTTEAIADTFAQLELDNAQFPPFRGTIAVKGRIPLKGGYEIDVCEMLDSVGENVLIKDLTDPNSQALGRKGRIHGISYNSDDNEVQLTIDDNSGFIEQLRNRFTMLT